MTTLDKESGDISDVFGVTGMMKEKAFRSRVSRSEANGAVVTVGTFDGIHLGHREVLGQVIERAARDNLDSVVVTFEPHPLRILRPSEAPSMLSTLEEKLEILSRFSLGHVEVIPFTREFAALSAMEFVSRILIDRFGMRELVIGHDHGFGRGREGSVPLLRSMADELGFELCVVDPVEVNGERVSSSRIRKFVSNADFVYPEHALGRRYSLLAQVIQGEGRGTTIGFPTANLLVTGEHKLIPPSGVYAVRCRIRDTVYSGMMHQGARPTFSGDPDSIEVHLIGFEGDLVGMTLEVEYLQWIRGVRKFPGPDQLKEQLQRDREIARKKYRES